MPTPFVPHLNGLRHQRPSANGAATWMSGLYGAPFAEARATLFAKALPTWVEPKSGTSRAGARHLSTHWDDVVLLTWCDGSCTIARPGDGGFHVLPATFSVANQIHPADHLTTPYNDRTNDGLRLWTAAGGLLWTADGVGIEAAAVEAMVRAWVWERAEEVEAQAPVLDPRVHAAPVGGRFAPFSPFPKPDGPVLTQVEALLTAVCHIAGCDRIWATRASAPSPWRTGNTSEAVRGSRSQTHPTAQHFELTKSWRTWLKAALFGPHGVIPASMRVGMEATSLCEVRADLAIPTTAHARLAAEAALIRHRATIAALVHPDLLDSMPGPRH